MPDIDTSPAALRALAEALVTPKLGETATVHFKALSLVKVTEMLRALAAEKEAADRGPGCEAAARVLAGWLGYAWDGLHDRDIADEHPDWAYNGIGDLRMQGGRPALRRIAQAMLAAATVKPGLPVGATDRLDALALWKAHGGDTYGPRVEHVSMPLSKFAGFVDAALAPLRASLAAAEKERDEALRDAIEFTQKVDAGLVRDEEYLRLHREKMEQYDRRVAAEARAEKAEAERDEARKVIAWANNSLYGSHGFSLSLDGGPANEHHLADGVEELKDRTCRKFFDVTPMAWHPIETAPRDGTRLWCFWPDAWSEERQAIGWFVSSGEAEYWTNAADSDPNPPTHWMPLPAAPADPEDHAHD